MKRCDFKSMSADQLWILHEKITTTLAAKITPKKRNSTSAFASLTRESDQKLMTLTLTAPVDLIRRFLRNSKIRRDHPRLGPAAVSNRAG